MSSYENKRNDLWDLYQGRATGLKNILNKHSLKSCPFCGGKASFHTRQDDGDGFYDLYQVFCMFDGKGCMACTRLYDQKDNAAKAWNKRVK